MPVKSEKLSVFICILIALLAYWPVASFQFAIKNDFFTAYYPLKLYLSEAINNGIFPVWNPYLNYGFPVYGDMSEAWWNPATWIISLTVGYNPWTFTLELITYLLLAVVGMHKLSSLWSNNLSVRSLASVTFACCGYFTGHLQHFNWISAAGTLPLLLYFLALYIQHGKTAHLAITAFLATWFASAAHPGLIIGLAVFSIPFIRLTGTDPRQTITRSAKLFFLTSLCCGGMIYGYMEVLPHTNRSADTALAITAEGSTTIFSWISFLLPAAVMKGRAFVNDVSLRNCYMGILPILALTVAFRKDCPRPAKQFAAIGLLFLALSSDLLLPAYRAIPPFKYIRLSGELRVFAIISFIIASAIILDQLFKGSLALLEKRLRLYIMMMILIALGSLAYILFSEETVSLGSSRQAIRSALANIHPVIIILPAAIIQLTLATAMLFGLRKHRTQLLAIIVFADCITAAFIALPFTGVGSRSVNDLNSVYMKAPKGIPIPENLPEREVVADYPDVEDHAGNWALMSRQVAQRNWITYPLYFDHTLQFMNSDARASYFERAPFSLLSEQRGQGIAPHTFQATDMEFQLETAMADTLLLKQNYYSGWYYSLNKGPLSTPITINGFSAIPLQAGKNELNVFFHKPLVKALLIIQFILMGIMLIPFAISSRKRLSH